MKNVVIAVLVLVILAGGIYLALPYLNNTQTVQPEQGQTEQVQVENAYIREETDNYDINVEYPRFGIPEIDAQIEADVNVAVSEFKEIPTMPMPDSVVQQYTFDGTFDSLYVGPDVISVVLILSQYTGGAHPLTLLSGLNFDRETGQRLTQFDAFEMIDMSVGEVSQAASTKFASELGDAFFSEGADTNPENFSSFSISENEVTFIFQQYQVAPYAAGPQEMSFERVE